MATIEEVVGALEHFKGEATLENIVGRIVDANPGMNEGEGVSRAVLDLMRAFSAGSDDLGDGEPLFAVQPSGRWRLLSSTSRIAEIASFLNQIEKSDVLKAIQDLDDGIANDFAPSKKYDLVYKGRHYAPKAVLGLAARRVNGGQALKPSNFVGGEQSGGFKVLRSLGFTVQPKTLDNPEFPRLPSLTGRFWVEKCHVAGRADRMSGPHALGSALWSPQRSESGADIYSVMREVQAGDAVLHLTDNAALTGVSIAAAAVDDSFTGLDGTDWEKAKAYRIQLTGFEKLDPPIRREAFLGETMHKDVLLGILSRHSKLFFNRSLELNQGAYLTSAPKELVDFFNGIYRQISGRDIPYTSNRMQADPIPIPPNGRARFWAIAAGEAGRLWNEFQELGIAAIGWDSLGNLSAYRSQADAHRALVAVQGGNPTNDALCLYQFAHEIQTGDYVVVSQFELRGL